MALAKRTVVWLVALLPAWLSDRIAWALRVSTSLVHWHGRESKQPDSGA